MATLTECPDCEKTFYGRQCPYCNWTMKSLAHPVGTTNQPAEQQGPPRCPVDGGPLLEKGALKGFCVTYGGFPAPMGCPFVCPMCRKGTLDWSGACHACHGTTTVSNRDTWTFPGDGYYTHDTDGEPLTGLRHDGVWAPEAGQHYVKVQEGPRPAVSRADGIESAREMARLVERIGLHTLTPDKEP